MLSHLLKLRPYAFHCCGESNFDSIRGSRSLRSAAELLSGSAHEYLLRTHRSKSVRVPLPSGPVEIRDNAPLRKGSLALQDGLSLEDFLFELNSRVFLWPGNLDGPIPPGRRHFAHYRDAGAVFVLRVPTAALIEANGDRELSVTMCNSGAARHQRGKPVLRGRSTFLAPQNAPCAKVKEFTFLGLARLPRETEWSRSLTGPWSPL